jgi:hypothetical protein
VVHNKLSTGTTSRFYMVKPVGALLLFSAANMDKKKREKY